MSAWRRLFPPFMCPMLAADPAVALLNDSVLTGLVFARRRRRSNAKALPAGGDVG